MEKDFSSYIVTLRPAFRFFSSPIPLWLNIAMSELGESEIAGDEDNPKIVEYLQSVDLSIPDKRVDEIAWCSAFVNWVIENSGCKSTRKALARSWLDWGITLEEPKFGCVVVIKRGKSKWMGHVGFLLDVSKDGYLIVLGGNQNNRVGINTYKKSRLLGYRWPS